MKQYFVTLLGGYLLLAFVATALFAQEDPGAVDTDITALNQTQAEQNIEEIALRSFEDEGFWTVNFSRDNGLIRARTTMSNGSQAKTPLPSIEGEGKDLTANQDSGILGVRVDFRRRAIGEAFITPVRPVPVEGIVKTVSVWVAGRNSSHVLMLQVRDRFGNQAEVFMGRLNFLGWKKLTATIPPNLKQFDYHFSNMGSGILIEGFKIKTNMLDAVGSFYVYLDDLRAMTDLVAVNGKDPDDPLDNW